jgi:hypothetical protein
MMLSKEDTRLFQNALEGSLSRLVDSLYPAYYKQYWNYRNKIGPHCPMCKAAARHIYVEEVKRKGQEFIQRFKENDWVGYS